MAKKFTELPDEQRKALRDEVDAKTNAMSIDPWDGDCYWNHAKFDGNFGLCETCTNFQYAKTEFKVRKAWCYELDIVLSPVDPIIECTRFDERGKLSIREMYDMAWVIEPRNPIGFEGPEEDGPVSGT